MELIVIELAYLHPSNSQGKRQAQGLTLNLSAPLNAWWKQVLLRRCRPGEPGNVGRRPADHR